MQDLCNLWRGRCNYNKHGLQDGRSPSWKNQKSYDNFTFEELKRQYPTKPVINIPITGYDIVQALYEAKNMYHCRKAGIVGRFFHMYQYEHMEEITGVKTSYHPVDQGHDLEYCVAEAVSQGCDCIIGGYSAYLYLKNSRTDLPVVTIKVSRETISMCWKKRFT